MKYMIVFDGWDRPLIDEMITDKVERLREDHDAVNDRLATVLEALEIVPVPVTQTSLGGMDDGTAVPAGDAAGGTGARRRARREGVQG